MWGFLENKSFISGFAAKYVWMEQTHTNSSWNCMNEQYITTKQIHEYKAIKLLSLQIKSTNHEMNQFIELANQKY